MNSAKGGSIPVPLISAAVLVKRAAGRGSVGVTQPRYEHALPFSPIYANSATRLIDRGGDGFYPSLQANDDDDDDGSRNLSRRITCVVSGVKGGSSVNIANHDPSHRART